MADGRNFQGFPLEIIVNILLLLPAESLIRMMLVCKDWYAVITDAKFMLEHFEQSGLRGNESLLCGPRFFTRQDCLKFLAVTNPCEILLDKEIRISFHTFVCQILNACNGLVCFTDAINFGTTIYLLNPFIRKFRAISTSTIDNIHQLDREFNIFVLGFGFHTPSNDHKIVRIAYADPDHTFGLVADDQVEDGDVIYGDGGYDGEYFDDVYDENDSNLVNDVAIEVYSLSTNSWERIEVDYFPWIMNDNFSRTSIHDSVHWMAFKRGTFEDEPMILSFDFATNKFQEISLPVDYHAIEADEHSENLFLIKNSLAFGVVYPIEGRKFCTLWVMENYGVVESWKKLFHIQVFHENIHKTLTSVRKNGVVFEGNCGDLFFFNFHTNGLKGYKTYRTSRDSLEFMVVSNSLFLLGDPPENGNIHASLQDDQVPQENIRIVPMEDNDKLRIAPVRGEQNIRIVNPIEDDGVLQIGSVGDENFAMQIAEVQEQESEDDIPDEEKVGGVALDVGSMDAGDMEVDR